MKARETAESQDPSGNGRMIALNKARMEVEEQQTAADRLARRLHELEGEEQEILTSQRQKEDRIHELNKGEDLDDSRRLQRERNSLREDLVGLDSRGKIIEAEKTVVEDKLRRSRAVKSTLDGRR